MAGYIIKCLTALGKLEIWNYKLLMCWLLMICFSVKPGRAPVISYGFGFQAIRFSVIAKKCLSRCARGCCCACARRTPADCILCRCLTRQLHLRKPIYCRNTITKVLTIIIYQLYIPHHLISFTKRIGEHSVIVPLYT